MLLNTINRAAKKLGFPSGLHGRQRAVPAKVLLLTAGLRSALPNANFTRNVERVL